MSGYELIVIGGGEAGISAALHGASLGAKVLMINREPELGGGCVRTGTLPSKTLSNAAHFLENLKKGRRFGIAVDENAAVDYKVILETRHKTTLCEVGILATLIRKNGIETNQHYCPYCQSKCQVYLSLKGGLLVLVYLQVQQVKSLSGALAEVRIHKF